MKLVDKPLTDLQKKFARLYVNAFYGHEYLSNTEVAIKAGYSADSAYQRAYELLNSKLKEDWKSKHNIDPDKHMARLNHLGNKAEQKDMFGVALRAEELRGKVAGYHVDRSLIKTSNDLNDKTEEELTDEMKSILENYQHILNPKEQKNGKE